jgi:hypothetical protein
VIKFKKYKCSMPGKTKNILICKEIKSERNSFHYYFVFWEKRKEWL